MEALTRLDGWEARYRYIIELGRKLPRLKAVERTDGNRVHGCVSQVWLVSHVETRGPLHSIVYRGESDAMIVQGLMALLLAVYSGNDVGDIPDIDALAMFRQIGLQDHLTAQRSNGLVAVVDRIRAEAQRHAADGSSAHSD